MIIYNSYRDRQAKYIETVMCISVIEHLVEIFFLISALNPAFIILDFNHTFIYAWGWTSYIFL